MTYYYPQAALSLRILFEDFGATDPLSGDTLEFNCIPKDVTVSINDYTKADTFSCTLDYKNFPFDPRTIRSLGVSIFLEDILAQVQERSGAPKQIQPIHNLKLNRSNAVFLGFADEDTIRFDEENREVSFEGRDFTSLLIDTPWDSKQTLQKNTFFENMIQNILVRLPSTKDIKVDLRGIDDIPPLARLEPDYNPLSGEKNRKKNETYWDVIQDLARIAGLIIFMELDKLIITKPNALYDKSEVKHFVWGKNLTNLEFKRKLGRTKDFNVGVRSLAVENKEVVEAIIPREGTYAWSISTGIPLKDVKTVTYDTHGKKQEKVAPAIMFRVPNIRNKAHLVSVGENIFEELSRQQIEGSLETGDMVVKTGERQEGPFASSFMSFMSDFDITKIRIATPIELRIEDEELRMLQRTKGMNNKIAYLMGRGYKFKVASAIASAMDRFSTTFYTKAIEYRLSANEGFSCNINFINWIELPAKLASIGG